MRTMIIKPTQLQPHYVTVPAQLITPALIMWLETKYGSPDQHRSWSWNWCHNAGLFHFKHERDLIWFQLNWI